MDDRKTEKSTSDLILLRGCASRRSTAIDGQDSFGKIRSVLNKKSRLSMKGPAKTGDFRGFDAWIWLNQKLNARGHRGTRSLPKF